MKYDNKNNNKKNKNKNKMRSVPNLIIITA